MALLERNSELAREIVCDDDLIDRLDVELEEKCIRLLALRQPAARDLRFITTAIKITGHLERIGDMAANIAEKVIILNELPSDQALHRPAPDGGDRPGDDPTRAWMPW